MLAKVYSAALHGIDSYPVEVEVDYRNGMSYFAIVGLGDKSVQEAKERIVSALRNSGAEYVPKRLIVNLAPANRHKSGAQFDLAIAVGYLVATKQINLPGKCAFMGELALHGAVKPITGALALAVGLSQQGFRKIYVAEENYHEVNLIPGINVVPVRHLADLIAYFRIGKKLAIPPAISISQMPLLESTTLLSNQLGALRALTIAAAGGHHLLFTGSPGTGKSTLAKLMPLLLPMLTFSEQLEVSKIFSVKGLLTKEQPLITTPPFRAPHHSITLPALIGGMSRPRPGEITLSHKGVLFLDELGEFSSVALEALRQPLEEKYVTVSRETVSLTFPADFICIGAMNPCKCGYLGDDNYICKCSPGELKRYKKRISGALWERFDLQVSMFSKSMSGKTVAIDLAKLRKDVAVARNVQMKRQDTLNSQLTLQNIETKVKINTSGKAFLDKLNAMTALSARSYIKILRIARTIADLEGEIDINAQHLSEASALRSKQD